MTNGSTTDFRLCTVQLFVLLSLFVLSRLLYLLVFPIFNDEAIYIQFAQYMHADWDLNKFIPLDNPNKTWKPPLINWMAAPFVGFGEDPLLPARALTVLVSLTGFLSIYAFAGYWFNDKRTALWTGLFWTFNPMVLFYDREYIAETFVYSFSAAAILFTFLTVSRSRFYMVPAVLFGAAGLLSKQSGLLSIVSLLFFMALEVKKDTSARIPGRLKVDYRNVTFIALTVVLSYLVYHLVIPAKYFANYARHTTEWTFSLSELIRMPVGAWAANAKVVFALYSHYYSLLSLVLVAFFIRVCATKRLGRDLLILWWFLFNSMAIILALRGFNEYMYNTSNVVYLTLILGGCVHYMQRVELRGIRTALALPVRYGAAVALLALWIYPLPQYYTSAEGYINRFGTPWMRQAYLLGRSNGFGISEVVTRLKQERANVVFVDPQWGNPGTTLNVYAKQYPTLNVRPIENAVPALLDRYGVKGVIVIFRDRGDRGWEKTLKNHPICRDKTVYRLNSEQVPLIYCRG